MRVPGGTQVWYAAALLQGALPEDLERLYSEEEAVEKLICLFVLLSLVCQNQNIHI